MRDYSPEKAIGFVGVMVFLCGLSFVCGSIYAEIKHNKELIKRGLAEWTIDKEGKVELKWKETKP